MDKVSKLDVFCNGKPVGILAAYKPYRFAFEYSDYWLSNGFSISPLSLPLEKRVFIGKPDPFDGIFGIFNDSLPDGWGRLLVDRILLKNHIDPHQLTPLDRLSIVGSDGLGALEYHPRETMSKSNQELGFDEIAKECKKILANKKSNNLDYLYKAGGSPGGARPKILRLIEDDEWIIKFPSTEDPVDVGYIEYQYACCAKKCGIEMSEVKLFDSKKCKGYFGTKRFDKIREGIDVKRVHVISVSGLLETSHRIPNLDYNILMKLTYQLTRNMQECEKLYRLMCFNIFAHNRDDHPKNFSFIYSESEKGYVLSPAYDLTYSNSLNGEHATTVNGNGINPGIEDAVSVAKNIGIKERRARSIAEEIKEYCKSLSCLSI